MDYARDPAGTPADPIPALPSPLASRSRGVKCDPIHGAALLTSVIARVYLSLIGNTADILKGHNMRDLIVKIDSSKVRSISSSYSGAIRMTTIEFMNGTRLHGHYDFSRLVNFGELVYA
jgi:hypothetical protein